jgi:hypothetical protein
MEDVLDNEMDYIEVEPLNIDTDDLYNNTYVLLPQTKEPTDVDDILKNIPLKFDPLL